MNAQQRVVIRLPLISRMWSALFITVWCAVVAIGFFDGDGGTKVVTAVMIVAGLAIGWQLLRLSVVADSTGLLIRNNFRSRRVAWADVEDFRVASESGLPVGRVLHVLLRDRTSVPLDVTRRLAVTQRGKQRLRSWDEMLRSWLPE